MAFNRRTQTSFIRENMARTVWTGFKSFQLPVETLWGRMAESSPSQVRLLWPTRSTLCIGQGGLRVLLTLRLETGEQISHRHYKSVCQVL